MDGHSRGSVCGGGGRSVTVKLAVGAAIYDNIQLLDLPAMDSRQ